jgi:hypothetical protein
VMASILHLAHNMDEDDAPDTLAPHISPPPISAFVVAGRGSHSGRGHPVVLAVVADYPKHAAPAAAWTTSCPLALPRMTPYCGGHSPSVR